MTTVAIIRRENARELASHIGGQAELARRLGISDSQMNQTIGKNPSRNIGNNLARRIEQACGKDVGYLDNCHSSVTDKLDRVNLVYATQTELCILTAYREASVEGRAAIEAAASAASSLSSAGNLLKYHKR